MNYNKLNLFATIILSILIIFGWQHFYEKPRQKQLQQQKNAYKQQNHVQQKSQTERLLPQSLVAKSLIKTKEARISLKSELLSGSIRLSGLRFDDLILLKYKQDLSPDSPNVSLLAPSDSDKSYFMELGWYSADPELELPNSDSLWTSDSDTLTPSKPVNLFWINNSGVKFYTKISMDENYLFTIDQTIENTTDKLIDVQNYGLINRKYNSTEKSVNILHQGPIATIGDELKEYSFENIKDKKIEKFKQSKVDWIGITDKYWLSSLIPDKTSLYSSNFTYSQKNGFEKFQIDFISPIMQLKSGENLRFSHKLFAGAKKVDLLDKYEKNYNIKLFDRAIDFGWFYIITKPIFNMMNFFYHYVGNFGISILIVTIIIKLAMFTLANKSYRSMKKMKSLQPEMDKIKEMYSKDKMRLNQEIMLLYKKEKVNPVSGCLPLIVQIPVFFAIYKVLYVTIEMRHAPFFGWIHDLSAPDPTSIFNLFGLIPFTPPSILMIGVWPILMALTMFFQQQMSPAPADPMQATVMKFMPLMFLVMFSSFPAGLLIYWSWNNILSILQQYCINKLDNNVTR